MIALNHRFVALPSPGQVCQLFPKPRQARRVWWALMPVAVLLSLLSYEPLLPVIGLMPRLL